MTPELTKSEIGEAFGEKVAKCFGGNLGGQSNWFLFTLGGMNRLIPSFMANLMGLVILSTVQMIEEATPEEKECLNL